MIGLEKEKSCEVSQIARAGGEDTAVRSILDKKSSQAQLTEQRTQSVLVIFQIKTNTNTEIV